MTDHAAPVLARPGPTGSSRRRRLGDVLLQRGIITPLQFDQALELQKSTGCRLGQALRDLGHLTTQQLASALAEQLGLELILLHDVAVRPELGQRLPQSVARRLQAVVLSEGPSGYRVAVADPLDLSGHDELVRQLGAGVELLVAPADQVSDALERLYPRNADISGLARVLELDIGGSRTAGAGSGTEATADVPVARFLQTVFEDAVQCDASDVHVEPRESEVVIRLRIDGVLQVRARADASTAAALAQRLKLISGLDIAERRLPQDGRFEMTILGAPLDVRISTLPSQFGESVVMRLLRRTARTGALDQLGMTAPILANIRSLLAQSSGMVLVTGPTGSGKSTTLHAALGELDTASLKVITVEDPIEYRVAGVVQTQVHDRIDLSFSRVLRAALRQDPDVILVGEVRDAPTAEIALRAAITGHLVLSTLHTRDAASTPLRLIDMGVPPFMVATSLQAVVAQRLVRLNCMACTAPVRATAAQLQWMERLRGLKADVTVQAGSGCPACRGTGYAGRTGIYEMFEMDAELIDLVAQGDAARFSRRAYERMHGQTLAHHGLSLVEQGRITVAQAMRAAGGPLS